MKKITVEVKDGPRAELTQEVQVNHLSDLGDSVKEVVDDFVEPNDGGAPTDFNQGGGAKA